MSRVLPPPVEGELRYPTLPRLLSEREDEVEEAEYREEPKDVESQVTQDGLDTEEDDDDIFVSPPTMKRRAGGLFGRLRDAREGRGNAAAVVVVRKYDDEPATAETSFMTDVSYTTALTSQRNGTSFTALAPSSPVRAAPSSPIRPTVSASFSMPSPGGFPFSSRKPTRAVIGEVFDALREHGIVIPTYTAESKLREILTIHADRAEGFRRG